MKHFVVVGVILLFCFGVLPAFFQTTDSSVDGDVEREHIESSTETVEDYETTSDLDALTAPSVERRKDFKGVEDCEKNESCLPDERDMQRLIRRDLFLNDKKEKVKELFDYIRYYTHDKKSDGDCEDCESTSVSESPIDDKMINDHRIERSQKEVPGSNKIENTDTKACGLSCCGDLFTTTNNLKIVDSATVVMQDGLVNL